MLLYGSRDEIARRLAELRGVDLSEGVTLDAEEPEEGSNSISLDFELHFGDQPDAQATLHTLLPPELPEGLSPGQNAQMSELLQYLHLRMRNLIESAEVSRKTEKASIPQRRWQDLLDLESRLARYLRSIGEPS